MDEKAKTLRLVESALSGPVEITCDDPGAWTFSAAASVDDGRDVVAIELTSPVPAPPPRFGVFFQVPGDGVQNVWTSHFLQDGYHLRPRLWWTGPSHYDAHLAREIPLAVGFNSAGVSKAAIACSEPYDLVRFGLYADDRTCDVVGRCEFFVQPVENRTRYAVKVLFDRRGRPWYDVVRDSVKWISRANGFTPMKVPLAAREPLYSTWYAYLQDVHAGALEDEARLAASLGMKTMILDDGWQKEDSRDFYSATGDWMPAAGRFPDMRGHVAKVHAAGLKYMLWFGISTMGNESRAFASFKDKLLSFGEGTGTLDPRFPEVRAYIVSFCERAVSEWGFDGLKLDFIDAFTLDGKDPAEAQGYAGRDFRSLPHAVDRLMKEITDRLREIRPDVLVELRQPYVNPGMLRYGNMLRAADCPADPCANRRRICDMRLTSDGTAVHSDMLVWSAKETPQGAALPILNALFSTVQYSMILSRLPVSHREVVRHWIEFSRVHRKTLLEGDFRPLHPEIGYPLIVAEGEGERVVAAYSDCACAPLGKPDRATYVVNATGTPRVLVDMAAPPRRMERFDVAGRPVDGSQSAPAGLSRIDVPQSGYVKIEW